MFIQASIAAFQYHHVVYEAYVSTVSFSLLS